MSAIQMTCSNCGSKFIAGVVGTWAWPAHVCPDGTKNAPATYGWKDNGDRTVSASSDAPITTE